MLAVQWTTTQTVVFFVPFGLVLLGAVVWLFMRNTIRSRIRIDHQYRVDPDIDEWLIVFDWSRKVLYVPTILASLAAGVLTILFRPDSDAGLIIGGVWLAIFVLNFLIDEYEISFKIVILVAVMLLLVGLWLAFMNWLMPFLRMFLDLKIAMTPAAYFIIGGLMLAAVIISWIKGLFYYIALTPNYLNIQVGPTESGEQINHTDYTTRVDTGDFLERLLGFGRIVVTFRDTRRSPMYLLTWSIGKKATTLESIRGKLAVDHGRKGFSVAPPSE